MELVLNVLWLSICVASLAVWHGHGVHARTPRRHCQALPGLVALGVALLLLFPVLSLTDDLHAPRVLLDDPTHPCANSCKARRSFSGDLTIPKDAAGFVLPGFMTFCRYLVGRVNLSTDATLPAATWLHTFDTRGPPAC